MRPLRVVMARLRGMLRGRAVDLDLDEQIKAHLAEAAEEYERQGLSREDAMHAARRSFGGMLQAKDAHQDLRSFGWVEDARRDVWYALRSLGRMPAFTAIVIATMALAIGTATALFSVIDAALLRPAPYPNPEAIVSIYVADSFEERTSPSAADIENWRANTTAITRLGMGRPASGSSRIVSLDGGTPEPLAIGEAAQDFLEVFGGTPILGRAITDDDARQGAPLVLLVSYHYWQARFGGAAEVIGRAIRVDGEPATIIGVLPPGFYSDTALWRPHVVTTAMYARRGSGMEVYGRLQPGVDVETAALELSARLSGVNDDPAVRAWLVTLYGEAALRNGRTAAVLGGAVVLIVLIACVNVAGLLFARGTTREPELAIRKSIGASRGRLVRQLLAESAVLALIGGLAGVTLAWMTLDAIAALIPMRLPRNAAAPSLDLRVLTFATVMSMLTAITFGLAPAFASSRGNARTFSAAGRMRHGSVLSRRSGQALIAVELAMALVLVTGAGLMIRSFSKLLAIDVGFEPGAIYTMEVVPAERDPAALRAYFEALLQNVRRIPGLAAVGVADRPPLDGSGSYTTATVNGNRTRIRQRGVMPGFFEAAGLPLLLGRFPADSDYATNPPFVVLSESAARAMFPDQVPTGQQLTMSGSTWSVVAVVSDALTEALLPDERGAAPDLYVALQPNPKSPWGTGTSLIVRPAGHMPELAEQLREAALAVGPSVFVGPLRAGRDWYNDRLETPRQQTMMLSALGGLGLVLTLVGIFATTAYAVARRTHEVGVRMALGARPDQMVLAIVRDTAWPVALGIVLGLAGAVAATRVIASFLFETTPTDPLTLATTVVALAMTALLAAWIPARRAARVDPVAALRAE